MLCKFQIYVFIDNNCSVSFFIVFQLRTLVLMKRINLIVVQLYSYVQFENVAFLVALSTSFLQDLLWHNSVIFFQSSAIIGSAYVSYCFFVFSYLIFSFLFVLSVYVAVYS